MSNPSDSNFGGQLAYVEPKQGHVELDDISLQLDQKTYRKYPIAPFAPKTSQGAPKYGDYDPKVTPAAQDNWIGGYGTSRARGGDDEVEYMEGFNVDPATDGRVIISPAINYESLPGLAAGSTPVDIKEFNGTMVCRAGTALFYRTDATGMWTACGTVLPGTPGKMMPFGTALFLSLGENDNMQFTGNFTTFGTTQPARTLAADKSALYRAFGTNQVQASTSGTAWTEGTATVGDRTAGITDLVPGGGLITLGVGKEDGFWAIPSGASGTATKYLSFDRRYSRNCQGMIYHGIPIAIPNGRGLWDFSLSSIDGGNASNISPGWDSQEIGQVRGEIRALGESMRWLYASLNDQAPDAGTVASYINRRDSRSGRWHTWLQLGSVSSEAMYYRTTQAPTGFQSANPTLWFGAGTQIAYVTLPINSEDPLGDVNCRFNTSASGVWLLFPKWDFGLPDEDKTLLSVRVMSTDITGGARNIAIDYQVDGQGGWRTDLSPNTAYSSPRSELFFPTPSRPSVGNLLSNNQYDGGETGNTIGFDGPPENTRTSSTEQAWQQTHSIKVLQVSTVLSEHLTRIPVIGGHRYTFSAHFRAYTGSSTIAVGLQFYNAAGDAIGLVDTTQTPINDSGWALVEYAATSPDAAATALPFYESSTGGVTYYGDGFEMFDLNASEARTEVVRCRYVQFKARFQTDQNNVTPQLVALVARARVNVTNLWGWRSSASIAKGSAGLTGAVQFTDTVNQKAQLERLREEATTVIFKDRDGKTYDVQVSNIEVNWVEEPGKDAEWTVDFDVYQANEGLAGGYMAIYDEPFFGEYAGTYDADSYYYAEDD